MVMSAPRKRTAPPLLPLLISIAARTTSAAAARLLSAGAPSSFSSSPVAPSPRAPSSSPSRPRASSSSPPPRKERQGGETDGGVVRRESSGGRKGGGLRSPGCLRTTTMSSLGTSKGILEIAKFGVYVSVPVALTYLVATDSKTLKKLMGLRPYVVYPPEGPRPPPPEELRERAREIARKRQQS